VEFNPEELVLKLPGARWADIVQPSSREEDATWGVREPETIGVLTGNPCDSGLDLCGGVITHIRHLLGKNSLGDVSMPKILVVSNPEIGISMEMDIREDALRQALLGGIEELCAAGAKILAHPAHTTHFFAPEMAKCAAAKGARFLSMVDATVAWLRKEGVTEIALLGTHYVTDFNSRWSVYRDALEGIEVHHPSQEGWNKIHDLGYAVQQTGPNPQWFNWMRDLLKDEVPEKCKHVVLAMTEFSPVVRHLKNKGRRSKILIDPVDVYAEAIAREYLGLPWLV
jgi:aspartate racemase